MSATRVVLFLLLAALLGCSSNPSTESPTRPTLAQLDGEITRAYFSAYPEIASYYGVPENVSGPGLRGRLNARAPADEDAKRATFRALRTRLAQVDAESLGERERVFHALLTTQVHSALAPADVVDYGVIFSDWGMWYVPYAVTQLSGPQDAVPKLLESQHAIKTAVDAEDYLARLGGYARTVDEVIEKVRHDRALGVVPPDFILGKAIASVQGRSGGDPAAHALVTGFEAKVLAAKLDGAAAWKQRATVLVRDSVFPANARLVAMLESQRAGASAEAGIWRLPQGEALYQAMILHMTDTRRTPREIHDLGLAEVARITREMDAILRAEGYAEGSVGARMTKLGHEPRFLYSNDAAGKARLLDDLNGYLATIAPMLPQWFGTLPKQAVVVRAIPLEAEASSSGGYYDPPALDGSRPGIYWINLRDTAIWPRYKLKTLTYHEGNPGHHLQGATSIGGDASVLSSVLFSNAFGEGWALYSEALAHEMGLYRDDPYGDLGRLQDEIHRAVRLVVDTGMHGLRWSRQQAIDYVIATEGSHPKEAEAEVDRYVVWPGQALGYKIGMLEIQRLRREAEQALGPRFDIKAFHDELLNDGGVPLQVLEMKVRRWTASRG